MVMEIDSKTNTVLRRKFEYLGNQKRNFEDESLLISERALYYAKKSICLNEIEGDINLPKMATTISFCITSIDPLKM